jgi:hypothetical protein
MSVRPVIAVAGLKIIHQLSGAKIMTKERSSPREDKKKPVMTPKEKKAAKKLKKESSDILGVDRSR